MIDNNVLGNRLNEHKQKRDQFQLPDNPLFAAFSTLFTSLILVFKVFVFGYSTKILFQTGWSFWEVMCIGVTINFLLTYIHDLIHKKDIHL
jgi:hypothetical protein